MQHPGFVDLQVNGYAGVDFNDARITAGAVDQALEAMARAGVVCCLPTVITAVPDILAERLTALDRAVADSRLGQSMVPGYHLEGPFLSAEPGYVGCHPAACMRDPDAGLVESFERPLKRPILLITLAPERAGAIDFIRWGRGRGKLIALGHTAATAVDIEQAVEAGAVLSTHLGNAMRALQPKFENPMMAQLAEDRLSASFICDGIHIPPRALKVMMRAKGVERSILVTDATAAAGAAPGRYRFAGADIELDDGGSVRVPGAPMLAGSALTMDRAVSNLVSWGIATQDEAVRMASENPRRLLAPALAAHGLEWPS